MSEKILPIPCVKMEEKTFKHLFSKIDEELDKLKDVVLYSLFLNTAVSPDSEQRYEIAEKAANTITAITSMLEAMGIDEEMRQEAQKRVNEKNKERGRF